MKAVRSSDWLGELEAALSHVGNALDKWPNHDRGANYQSTLIAGTRLLSALNSERGRSYHRGQRRREQPKL